MTESRISPPSTTTLLLTPRPRRRRPMRRVLRNPLAIASIVVLLALVVTAVFAPWLAPYPPDIADLRLTLVPPSPEHLLGTDNVGRDILSRLIWGSRTTLIGVLLVSITAFLVGVPTGLVAGYYGRFVDDATSWVANVLLALPGLIVLLAVRAAIGPNLVVSMIVLGIMVAPSYFRLTRATVQAVRNELYVDAAWVSGLSDARIMQRHVLTVIRAPIIIHAANVGGIAIGVQSALDFLGVGDPNTVTWGGMLADAYSTIYLNQLNLLWPALAIGFVTAAFVLLGNALRDALEDPEGARKSAGRRSATDNATSAEAGPDDAKGEDAAFAGAGQPSADHLVSVRSLSIAYSVGAELRTVVHDVSFDIARGEVVGVVGESGSGKSQSAFALLGLLSNAANITRGAISFDGGWLVAPGDRRIDQRRYAGLRGARIGYVPQEPMSNLDPAFTVGQQLTRPIRKVMGLGKKAAHDRAVDLLRSVGIADPDRTMRAYPHEISGGMAQRVLIAGAISCDPDLIVADEPTTALDVTVQAEVLEVLRGLQQRLGISVLLITHNFGVVADICDRVVVMQTGRVVEEGKVRDIIRHPKDEYTQLLLDSMLTSAHVGPHAEPPAPKSIEEPRDV